jgi:phage-related minor tail protein
MNRVSKNQLTLTQRLKAPTPKFFKTLRTIGLSLAAAGAALLAAPVALPAALLTVAGYLVLAGTVVTAVSQTTVDHKANQSVIPSAEDATEQIK